MTDNKNAIPQGELTADGQLPAPGKLIKGVGPLWRLTEGGWAVVNRSHGWALVAVAVSVLSFAVSVWSLVISLKAT